MGQTIQDDVDVTWFDDVELWDGDGSIALDARNFWELESLVKSLDTMETLAALAQIAKEYGNHKSSPLAKCVHC